MKNEFLEIKSKLELANFFDISINKLDYNLYNLDSRYYEFSINKKTGRKRKILAPIPSLKFLQRKLVEEIEPLYFPKKQVHSYVKKRGIRTNGKIHVNQKHVLNIDLENFFPSINFGRVRGVFMAFPFEFNEEVASLLAQLCCQNNELPQGSPTSPIISNLICRNLDSQLAYFARSNKCYYSRYSDDITFSTSLYNFPKQIAIVKKENVLLSESLIEIIEKNGFKLNSKKSSLRRNHEHQYVTGLTVNEKLNVKRKFIRQLRAMIYAWEKHGLQLAAREHFEKYSHKHKGKWNPALFVKIVEGKLLFLGDIRGKDDNIFKNFLGKFQRLSPNKNLQKHLSYQGDEILVFTEGNTDWVHLKAALNSFSVYKFEFRNLQKAIKIIEYDPNFSVGDIALKNILTAHLLSTNTTPIIGIFDSDNLQSLGEFLPKKENRYNNFENRVYTFYLPQPSHRRTNKNCIEHFYLDKDLKTEDEHGRRIYLSYEFDSESGMLKENKKIRSTLSRNKLARIEGIIDSSVRDNMEKSLALSKKDFAMNILDKKEGFKKVSFSSFLLIFDIVRDILKDIEKNT